MRRISAVAITAALVGAASAAEAQEPTAGFRKEFLTAITRVEGKVIQLADAMTESKWDWRPAAGVRSTCEVLMHVAMDKYFFGAGLGMKMPATLTNDKCPANKAEAKAHVTAAFKAFTDAVKAMPESAANDEVTLFGSKTTKRGLLLETAEHAGEHLGQLIAYARMNGVVPPWSR
jgi:uncharacterized damage-inducible protein DinB